MFKPPITHLQLITLSMKSFLEASGSILGYGLAGLCLLLMVLTYLTLNKVIEKENPSAQIILLVKFYFILTVVALLVVGVFTIVLVPQNAELKTQVVERTEQIANTTDTLNTLKTTAAINEQVAMGVKANAPEITRQADTLAAYVTKTVPADDQAQVLQRIDSLKNTVARTQVRTVQDSIKLQTNIRNQLFQIQRRILVKPN